MKSSSVYACCDKCLYSQSSQKGNETSSSTTSVSARQQNQRRAVAEEDLICGISSIDSSFHVNLIIAPAHRKGGGRLVA
jgi:hypothetical protein